MSTLVSLPVGEAWLFPFDVLELHQPAVFVVFVFDLRFLAVTSPELQPLSFLTKTVKTGLGYQNNAYITGHVQLQFFCFVYICLVTEKLVYYS